ncbi:MAG: hypothetical protein ACI8ZM_002486 [Crocinitomix sp.]|jgi:hypothetical protein
MNNNKIDTMDKQFYCQEVSGFENFSIDAWNEANATNDKERMELMRASGKRCPFQCPSCIKIVAKTREKNKAFRLKLEKKRGKAKE